MFRTEGQQGSAGDYLDVPSPPVTRNWSTEAVHGSDPPLSSLNTSLSTVADADRPVADPLTDPVALSIVTQTSTVSDPILSTNEQFLSFPRFSEETSSSVASRKEDDSFPFYQSTCKYPHHPSDGLAHPVDPDCEIDIKALVVILEELGLEASPYLLHLVKTKQFKTIEEAVAWILDRQIECEEMGGSLSTSQQHCKMVFVINQSLKMGSGKVAAQVGHATLGLYRSAMNSREGHANLKVWEEFGEKKIVVKGRDAEHLIELRDRARSSGLIAHIVLDAGHTQIERGSMTVLGIFGANEIIDGVTGTLKLL